MKERAILSWRCDVDTMALRQALVWPPIYDSKSRRIKGFYPDVITVSKRVSLARTLRELQSHKDATRMLVRAIVERDVIARLVAPSGYLLEATFPVDHILPGCNVIYLGFNTPEREADNSELAAQRLLVERLKRENATMSRQELELITGTYRTTQLTSIDAQTAASVLALFNSKFDDYPIELTVENIRKMPEDHIVMAAFEGERLIAVFMADRASVRISGQVLTFFDFVNVVSEKDGTALVPLMAHETIERAGEYANPIVYSEARADVPGLQVCCIRAGMQHCGILRASSFFRDKNDAHASFRNTHVWYVSL